MNYSKLSHQNTGAGQDESSVKITAICPKFRQLAFREY